MEFAGVIEDMKNNGKKRVDDVSQTPPTSIAGETTLGESNVD
jgi:hypothetical protein